MYKRVLLKLSGEALSSDYTLDTHVLNEVAMQVKKITEQGTKVGIVVGGGNIVRGRLFEKLGLERVKSDYMGMLATVINALAIEAALENIGVKAKTLSAIKAESVDMFDKEVANKLLEEGYVLVFGGGVGKPYHSTDTGCAQRAIDINAEVILMAKSGVDGVYTADPNKDLSAKRFDELTFQDIVDKNLQVIDLQAAELLSNNSINAFLFDMNAEDNIVKAASQEAIGTLIHN